MSVPYKNLASGEQVMVYTVTCSGVYGALTKPLLQFATEFKRVKISIDKDNTVFMQHN